MADTNAGFRDRSLAPLIDKKPGDYYYGTRRFSDDTLHLICCCGLFSTYGPNLVARLFRGDFNERIPILLENNDLSNKPQITRNPDLSNIQGSEVRGCFFQMLDNNHAIFQQWSHEDRSTLVPKVNKMVQVFKDAGESHMFVQCWNDNEGMAIPVWKRGAQCNTRSSKRFAKLADKSIKR